MHFLSNKKVVLFVKGLGELLMLCALAWGIGVWIWERLLPLFAAVGEVGPIAMGIALFVSVVPMTYEAARCGADSTFAHVSQR